jgi:hypothetical protein
MRIISINVTYARTFNLGEYNSMRLECALSADLDEGEDEIAAIRDSLPPGTVN